MLDINITVLNKMNIKNINIFGFLLLIIPPIVGWMIVYKFGVNAVFWDEFEYVRNRDHVLTYDYLFGLHNEHRIVLQHLLVTLLNSITKWNSKALMYCSQLFLTCTYLLTIFLYLKE